MKIKPHHAEILALFDAGHTPVSLIARGHTKRVVYQVLRKHRPKRKRAPRARTSTRRPFAVALHGEGLPVRRVAELTECSDERVYYYLKEDRASRSKKKS